MKNTYTRIVLFATSAVLVAALSAIVLAQSGGAQQSRDVKRTSVPIEQRIQPGDKELRIHGSSGTVDTIAPPPGVSDIDWRLQNSMFVLLVSIDNVHPALTEDHSWIKTEISAQILEVLTPERTGVRPGDTLKFEQDGGELVVRTARVRAVNEHERRITLGAEYLAFAALTDSGVIVIPNDLYRILENGLLQPVLLSDRRDQVAHMTLPEVKKALANR